MKWLSLVPFLYLVSTTCVAAITASELLEMCRSSNQFESGFCMGTIDGVLSGYFRGSINGAVGSAFWYLNKGQPKNTIVMPAAAQRDEVVKYITPFCPPEHTTRQQAASIAIEHIANHLESRHQDIGKLLPEIFKSAWPCEK